MASTLLAMVFVMQGVVLGADPSPVRVAEDHAAQPLAETWDAIFIQGAQVGYATTRTKSVREKGLALKQVEGTAQITLKRLGQITRIVMAMQSVETSSGEVIRFRTEAKLGPSATVTIGRVVEGTMQMTIAVAGKSTNVTLPWSPKIRGFFAFEQTLGQQPMKPGERRQFQALMPIVHQVAGVELQAIEYEQTKMLEGTSRLLKIRVRTKLLGSTLTSTLWSDATGNVLKTSEPVMQQATYRTTRAKAMRKNDEAPDLIVKTIIRPEGKVERPHEAQRVRYQVTIPDGQVSDVIPSSVAQRLGDPERNRAELIVRRVRIGDRDLPSVGDPPTDRDRKASSWIQSDDAKVVALAKQVVPDETDRGKIAAALEKHVHRRITKKNFSTALATAAEVAESLEGDCTEHAVLLAATCRARGVPARVVVGLVYVESLGGFGFHMWNEAWIADRWMPLDATLAQSGTGPGHIKLAHASMDHADATAIFLPVYRVMGKLKIRVEGQDR